MKLLPIDASLPTNLEPAELVGPCVEQTLANYVRRPRRDPFGGYLVIDELGTVIGCAGFKDCPTAQGEIEIAYCTFPPQEGKGHGTRTAALLYALAVGEPDIKTVIAHTLPERNASCRILERNGFRFAGMVVDPEDGNVWRSERKVTPH